MTKLNYIEAEPQLAGDYARATVENVFKAWAGRAPSYIRYDVMRQAFKGRCVPTLDKDGVTINHVMVSADDARWFNLRNHCQGRGTNIAAGPCARLLVNGALMMSDTRDEYRSNYYAIANATGVTLITGLGLGCVIRAIAARVLFDLRSRHPLCVPRPHKIIVIEKNETLIQHMSEHLVSLPFEIEYRHADALTYKPPKGEYYDFVYHDIWPDITTDNLPAMTLLKRRYGRRTSHQVAWQQDHIRSLRNTRY